MSRVRGYVIVGAAASLLVSMFLAATYRGSWGYQCVTGYAPIDEIYFNIGVFGSGEDNREVVLTELRNLARKGDRIENRHHWFEFQEFAFCAFPAASGTNQDVWLVCPTGTFRRKLEGGKPILRWPSDDELRTHWSRVC